MTRAFSVLMAAAMTVLTASPPTMAQNFNFGIFFGDERRDFDRYPDPCMTQRQIRNAIADRGYSDIFLNVANEEMIQVRANRDGWTYLLDFNMCTNSIEGRRQLRPAR